MTDKEKKGTMLSLEKDLVETAKRLGLNMSQIMNATLKFVIENGTLQPVYTELFLVECDIERIESEIAKYGELVENLDNRREELVMIKADLEKQVQRALRDTEVAKLYQQLGDLCKAKRYNIEECWDATEDIRAQLAKHGLSYNKEGFKDLVQRFRKV